jgi:hypothetical protein
MSDDEIKRIPISDLKSEDGAHELATSPEMQPYLQLMIAEMQGKDTAPHVAAIRALPLEKRYVWRVASALKWAFADLETSYVDADCQSLSPEDQKRLVELLQHRPVQLCLFLSALVGEEQMERLMISAIRSARAIAAQSDGQE